MQGAVSSIRLSAVSTKQNMMINNELHPETTSPSPTVDPRRLPPAADIKCQGTGNILI